MTRSSVVLPEPLGPNNAVMPVSAKSWLTLQRESGALERDVQRQRAHARVLDAHERRAPS